MANNEEKEVQHRGQPNLIRRMPNGKCCSTVEFGVFRFSAESRKFFFLSFIGEILGRKKPKKARFARATNPMPGQSQKPSINNKMSFSKYVSLLSVKLLSSQSTVVYLQNNVVQVQAELPGSSQELSGTLKSSLELSGALKSSQELEGTLRSSQKLSRALSEALKSSLRGSLFFSVFLSCSAEKWFNFFHFGERSKPR